MRWSDDSHAAHSASIHSRAAGLTSFAVRACFFRRQHTSLRTFYIAFAAHPLSRTRLTICFAAYQFRLWRTDSLLFLGSHSFVWPFSSPSLVVPLMSSVPPFDTLLLVLRLYRQGPNSGLLSYLTLCFILSGACRSTCVSVRRHARYSPGHTLQNSFHLQPSSGCVGTWLQSTVHEVQFG